MYDMIPTKGMSREEWLRLRKNGIGGSDAGAICGLNPYTSAMEVFQDKTTREVKDMDNEAMRQGRDLEQYVAQRFAEETGFKVRRSNMMYRSKENPFMIADVDRLVVGQDAGLECKTASAYNADKWKDGKIPPHYLIQCLHYMAVTGKREWYIAVVILGRDFQYHKIIWDNDLIGKLVAVEKAFWQNHVRAGVMPAPDGSSACEKMIAQYFKMARTKSSIPLVGFDEKLERRERLLEMIGRLEKEQMMIEQEIKCFMGDNERAFSDKYNVTWGNVESVRLDTKRIKKERPELYRDFATTTNSRKFTIKAA
ncbi:MAG: endonuclease [Hungatella sp.]|nr:endonuclease [Hungatella sp.]